MPVVKEKVVKVRKPKIVAAFKLGKYNTDTVVLKMEEETERNDLSDSLINKCCTRCNSRNVVRAIETKNINLLRAALNAKD